MANDEVNYDKEENMESTEVTEDTVATEEPTKEVKEGIKQQDKKEEAPQITEEEISSTEEEEDKEKIPAKEQNGEAGELAVDESEKIEEEGLVREYAFPMAPIVRIMKDELDKDKMIRSRVKVEMNKWLEQLCRRIARRMNRSEYTMVESSDFRTAIDPYETIDDIEIEKERIIATMEKIKYDCDSLIRDVQRKFIAPDSNLQKEINVPEMINGENEIDVKEDSLEGESIEE